jgi:hypothetical protein
MDVTPLWRNFYGTSSISVNLSTLRNIDRFLELKAQGAYPRPVLEIAMVDSPQTSGEIPDARRYWEQRGIRLSVQPMENRADHASIRGGA